MSTTRGHAANLPSNPPSAISPPINGSGVEPGPVSESATGSDDDNSPRKRGRPRKSDTLARERAAATRAALRALNIEEEDETDTVDPRRIAPSDLHRVISRVCALVETFEHGALVLDSPVSEMDTESAIIEEAPAMSTIRIKAQRGEYESLTSLEDDFALACRAALVAQPGLADHLATVFTATKRAIRQNVAEFGAYLPEKTLERESSARDIFPPGRPVEREALMYISPIGPLFSSLSRRPIFDNTRMELGGGAQIMQVVPTLGTNGARTLGVVVESQVDDNTALQSSPKSVLFDTLALVDKKLSAPKVPLHTVGVWGPAIDSEGAFFSMADADYVTKSRNRQSFNRENGDVTMSEQDSDGDVPAIDEDLIRSYVEGADEPVVGTVEQVDLGNMLLQLQELQRQRLRAQGDDVAYEQATEQESALARKIERQLCDVMMKYGVKPNELLDSTAPERLVLPHCTPSYRGLESMDRAKETGAPLPMMAMRTQTNPTRPNPVGRPPLHHNSVDRIYAMSQSSASPYGPVRHVPGGTIMSSGSIYAQTPSRSGMTGQKRSFHAYDPQTAKARR